MTHQIHPLVDQLLLEQGDYCPLEILLQEGRLSYADYEAWRNGELDFLDEAPFGDPDHIQQDLLQWKAVRRAVEQEPRWHTDAVLLLRHAQACDQLHQQAAALASWFELCWRFPAQGDALASIGNHELRRQWTAYLDLDPELPVQSFPAWLLLGKPGLTRILPDPDNHSRDARGTEVGVTACPASYRTLFRLQHDRVQARAERKTDDTMALRARLKQQDPVLFQHFLAHPR